MKRLIPIIAIAAIFFIGCASPKNNLFEKNTPNYGRDYNALKHAKKYCKNHGRNYDDCMDKEYLCAITIPIIVIGDRKTTYWKRVKISKDLEELMKRQGIYKRWRKGDCGYCEWMEILVREWKQ